MWPGSRWALVRKDLPTLRRNTLPTYEKLAPRPFVGPVNKSTWSAKCSNGSEILFFTESIKDDPDLNRWRGLEVNGFILEEANEITHASFLKAIERAGSWKVEKGNQPPPLIICTCNPAKNWVKSTFYDPWKLGKLPSHTFYLPAKLTDNPHLEPAYVENLHHMKDADPRAYETFVEGNWDTADEPDQLILWEWIEAALVNDEARGEQFMGVDVARFGDDNTVIALRRGNMLVGLDTFKGIDIVRTAELVQHKAHNLRIKPYNIRVDTVGLGAGVADILKREHLGVTEFIAGAKAEETGKFYKFKNKRAEAWWGLREGLKNGTIKINKNLPHLHNLLEDLTTPRYSISGDKTLKIESKDDIKKRIGRSTDYGDAVMQAFYSSGNIEWLKSITTM